MAGCRGAVEVGTLRAVDGGGLDIVVVSICSSIRVHRSREIFTQHGCLRSRVNNLTRHRSAAITFLLIIQCCWRVGGCFG